MRKYWNALRYGNAKTKRILVSVILLFLLFIAGIVLAVSGSGVTWGLIAVFAVIMDIVLLQSVRFGDVQMLAAKSKKEAVNAVKEKEYADLSQISAQDLKDLLVAYHVNASHVQVMIDSYPKEGVKQSPAYLWKAKGYLNFLVLGNKPRNFAVPLSQVTQVTYKKNVEVNPLSEYGQMRQPSVVNAMYQEFLPVYKEREAGGRRYYTKNLYVLEPGICITNTSMKNLRQILKGVPMVFTGVLDERYSRYYRQAYEMKILMVDQVLSTEEYKGQISGMLKQMADEEGDDQEFFDDLAMMVRARLVTQEVAKYFLEYRRKQADEKKKAGKRRK